MKTSAPYLLLALIGIAGSQGQDVPTEPFMMTTPPQPSMMTTPSSVTSSSTPPLPSSAVTSMSASDDSTTAPSTTTGDIAGTTYAAGSSEDSGTSGNPDGMGVTAAETMQPSDTGSMESSASTGTVGHSAASSATHSSTSVVAATGSVTSSTGSMWTSSSSETDMIHTTASSSMSTSVTTASTPSTTTEMVETTTGGMSVSSSTTGQHSDSSAAYMTPSGLPEATTMDSGSSSVVTSSSGAVPDMHSTGTAASPSTSVTSTVASEQTTSMSSTIADGAVNMGSSTTLPPPSTSSTIYMTSSVIVDAPITDSPSGTSTSHGMSSGMATTSGNPSSADMSSTYSSTATSSTLPSSVTPSMAESVSTPMMPASSSSMPGSSPVSSTASVGSSSVSSTASTSTMSTSVSSTHTMPVTTPGSSSVASSTVSSTVMSDATHTVSSTPPLPPVSSTSSSSIQSTASYTTAVPTTSTESSTPMMTVTMVSSTTTEAPMANTSMLLIFEGDCTLVMENTDHMNTFKSMLMDKLVGATGMAATHIAINDVRCGSIEVDVVFYDSAGMDIPDTIESMAESGGLSLAIPTYNGLYNFTSVSGTVEGDPIPVNQDDSSGWVSWADLDSVEQIIIIVTVCVVASLIMCTVCVLICRCHRRKHTKSFTLQETPPDNYNIHDFTLTKMDRPQPVYTEEGIVMPAVETNGHVNGVVKVGYENELYDISNQLEDEKKDSTYTSNPVFTDTDVEPLYDTADIIRSPSTERLMSASHRATDGGYDNPSFSSDDILDSGTEADATDGDFSQDELGSEPPLVEDSAAVSVSVPDPFSAASSDSGMAAAGSSNAASPSTSDTRAAALEAEPLSQLSDANDSLNSSTVPEIEEELEPVPEVLVSVSVPNVIAEEQPAESPEPDSSEISEMPPSPAKPSYENVPDDLPAPPPCALETAENKPEATDNGISSDVDDSADLDDYEYLKSEDVPPPADFLPAPNESNTEPQEPQAVSNSDNALNNASESGDHSLDLEGEAEDEVLDLRGDRSALGDKLCDGNSVNRSTDFEELATEL